MSKTLSFSKERIRVLVSSELASVQGGRNADVSSALPGGDTNNVSSVLPSPAKPTATAVSSALPGHGGVSSVRPTATAVSSVRPGPVAQPTATAVSSAFRW